MAGVATAKDMGEFAKEAASDTATFMSGVFDKVREGALSESEKAELLADKYAQQFRRYSDTANKYAERARLAGESRKAELFQRISQEFSKAASDRASMSAEAYLAKVASDATAKSAALATKMGPVADFAQMGAGLLDGLSTGDYAALGRVSTSILYSTVFAAFAAALLPVGLLPAIAVGTIAVFSGELGEWVWNSLYSAAKDWIRPRDPLVLDLDGDGIEAVGLDAEIRFDHDGDGVLSRTGWVGPDDALLVRDRDGDGQITRGAELFGDFTPLSDGGLADDGFAALADLDANGDGVVDANDPGFNELKLWQDRNQDGVSQADELIALSEAGIASLSTSGTLRNQALGNGNRLAREGGYARTDGTTATLGELDPAIDTFDSAFRDPVPVPDAVKTLPNMGGSGKVRGLRETA